MSDLKKVLFFFILPIVGVLAYPPAWLGNITLLALTGALFIALGFLLWNGRSLMLTLTIFLQGMNVIIRLMMFLPNTVSKAGVWDLPYAVFCLLGMAVSIYLVLRLDQPDVRMTMVR